MPGDLETLGDIATAAGLARAVEPATGQATTAATGPCLNCDTALAGAYCSACGQKAHVHRTLAAFGHDLAHSVFHFDGKIWRTLPLLAWRPGELTRRYVHGERAKFVSPFALFLFSVFLMVAIFGWAAPRFADVERPMSPAQVAQAVQKDRDDLARATRQLQALRQANPADRAAIDAELTRNAVFARELSASAHQNRPRDVAERRLRVQQRLAAAEMAKLRSARAQAIRAGQRTDSLDEEIRSLQLGQSVLQGTAGSLGAGAVQLEGLKADLGFAALNDLVRHALQNPQLALYKIQSNAYKFSWALIPISVPFVWLLFFWRRDLPLFDHAVFVTYSIAFMTLLASVCVIGIQIAQTETIAALMLVFYPLFHMYRQLRGAYHLGRAGAAVRTLLLAGFSVAALLLFAALVLALGLSS